MDSRCAERHAASSWETARHARCAAGEAWRALIGSIDNRMTQQAMSLTRRLQQERGRVWVVGHRGAMGYRPENTLASYEHALELGADWIECDVHLSRDGVPVVIHDETLDRTTNGHGLVRDHSLAELKRLDAGAWFGAEYAGERLLTLHELLEWARARDTVVDVEVKNAPLYYDGIEAKV